MRRLKFRHLVTIAVVSVLLAGCTQMQVRLGGGEQLASTAAKRVTSAYDVSSLLAQADMVLTHSLMAELPDTVDFPQRRELRRMIDDEFRTATLTAAVRQFLSDEAVQTHHVQTLLDAASALETPLARRMHGLQAKVGTDNFANGYNTFIQQSPNARRKARLQQINALVDHMGIIDLQSAFHLVLLKTVLETANAVTGPDHDMSEAEIDAILRQNRHMLRSQLEEQLPPILLYIYRDIDDASLQKYVKLQGAPALLWANQTLVKAIRNALEQAGQRVRQRANSL